MENQIQMPQQPAQPDPIKLEKKKLTGTASRCLWLPVILFGLASVFEIIFMIPYIVPQVEDFVKTGKQITTDFMSEPTAQIILMYLPMLLGSFFAVLIGRAMLKQKVLKYYSEPQVSVKFILCACVVVLGANSAVSMLSAGVNDLLSKAGVPVNMPNINPPQEFVPRVLALAYICVLGPIFEELVFRGLILRSLQPYGNVFAVVVSGVVFGVFHFNLVQLFPAMIIGMVFGWIAVKSESLIPSTAAHIINNTFAMAITLFGLSGGTAEIVISCVTAAAAVLLLVLGRRQLKLKKQEPAVKLTAGQKTVCVTVRCIPFYVLAVLLVLCVYAISNTDMTGLISKMG